MEVSLFRSYSWIFFNLSIQGADYNGDFHKDVEYLLAGSSNWVTGPSLPVKVRGPGATTTSGHEYLCKYSKYLSNCYPCQNYQALNDFLYVCNGPVCRGAYIKYLFKF